VAKRSRAHSEATKGYEVYWVPLDAVVDPTGVPAAVATGIGLTGPLGDRPLAPVLRTLRDRQALLVLDNCEHCWRMSGVIDGAARRLPDGDHTCD
jgi:predicted ATPase